jgi:hypothetical protein
MDRILKEKTVKRYHYQTHHLLRQHLLNFINAYDFAKRLKAFKGLMLYEFIIKIWQKHLNCFKIDPNQHNVEINN